MRPLNLQRLLQLPRQELFALHELHVRELAGYERESNEALVAHTNLRMIRYVLSQQNTIASVRRQFGIKPPGL